MNDPYLYPHTDILKNLADIRDREMLSCMEAEYTSIRLAELVTGESVSRFDFAFVRLYIGIVQSGMSMESGMLDYISYKMRKANKWLIEQSGQAHFNSPKGLSGNNDLCP